MKTFHSSRKLFTAFVLLNACYGMTVAQAAPAGQTTPQTMSSAQAFSQAKVTDKITLTVKHGTLLTLPEKVTRVLIADPKVASFHTPSTNTIFVYAESAGSTTLYALNSEDKVVLAAAIQADFDLPLLTKQINTEIEGANVKLMRSTENGIIVRGSVQTPQQSKQVIDAITAFTGGSSDDKGGGGQGGQGSGNAELDALQSAIESGSNIESKLAAFRKARDAKQADLKKAQDTLKSVLTVKQEAVAVVMGLIE